MTKLRTGAKFLHTMASSTHPRDWTGSTWISERKVAFQVDKLFRQKDCVEVRASSDPTRVRRGLSDPTRVRRGLSDPTRLPVPPSAARCDDNFSALVRSTFRRGLRNFSARPESDCTCPAI
jgi:hypothetical protein